jgi:hypothetical protein
MSPTITRRLRDLEARLACAFARLTLSACDAESLQLARINILHGLQELRLVLSELDSPHRRIGDLEDQYVLTPLGTDYLATAGQGTSPGPTCKDDNRT